MVIGQEAFLGGEARSKREDKASEYIRNTGSSERHKESNEKRPATLATNLLTQFLQVLSLKSFSSSCRRRDAFLPAQA